MPCDGCENNRYLWFINNTPISNGDSYILQEEDYNKSIALEITPMNEKGIPSPREYVVSYIENIKVDAVYSNNLAFAALKSNGTVVAWGHPTMGGSFSEEKRLKLINVSSLHSTDNAFVALKSDGSVVAWGLDSDGGVISEEIQAQLSDVVNIFSTNSAFAALKKDGTVISWGNPVNGGDSNAVTFEKIDTIFSNDSAFAALDVDGNVFTWGDAENGGDSTGIDLENITSIVSTKLSFAALNESGKVVSWGKVQATNPTLSENLAGAKKVLSIHSTSTLFAARKESGIISWSDNINDIGVAPVIQNEENKGNKIGKVYSIVSTEFAFAALRKNHTIVFWGDTSLTEQKVENATSLSSRGGSFSWTKWDGTTNSVATANLKGPYPNYKKTDIKSMHETSGAVAVLNNDGTVTIEGRIYFGGDASHVSDQLNNVLSIQSNSRAFAALKEDGTVITWGRDHHGGNSSNTDISTVNVDVKEIFNTVGSSSQ